jgi:hypothetical protein
MAKRYLHWRALRPAAASLAALALPLVAGCTGTEPTPVSANPAAGCVDDSKQCVERRMAALKGMVGDPKRAWITAPETPAGYATGVKLFAYRAKKADLTCAELAHGREETRNAPNALKSGSVPGMNDSRLAQVKDLANQVHKDLAKEFDRVCKSPTEAKKGFEGRSPKA